MRDSLYNLDGMNYWIKLTSAYIMDLWLHVVLKALPGPSGQMSAFISSLLSSLK